MVAFDSARRDFIKTGSCRLVHHIRKSVSGLLNSMADEEDFLASPIRPWHISQCSMVVRKSVKTIQPRRSSELKKAVINGDYKKVCAALKKEGSSNLNKLWALNTGQTKVSVPPLCVAVCLQNLPIVQCLLQHGADPNRVGRLCFESPVSQIQRRMVKVNALRLAIEEYPDQGFPFQPALAAALVQAGADVNHPVGNTIEEEEEEGGILEYDNPGTYLDMCLDGCLPQSNVVFNFLLDNGVTDLYKNKNPISAIMRCTGMMICLPEKKILRDFTQELIRRGLYDTTPPSSRPAFNEFTCLMHALKKAERDREKVAELLHTIHLLLDAGYRCSKSDVGKFASVTLDPADVSLTEKVNGVHVYSLKHLCRLSVRRSVHSWHCLDHLSTVPVSVVNYLKM